MKSLKIEKTDETPAIILDKEKEIFEFSGRSLPENAVEFYAPILYWINEYIQDPLDAVVITFRLDYFNTASSKYLLDIFFKLEDIADNVCILWCYAKDDEDMLEAGKEFAEIVESIKFEFQSYQPKY